MLKPFSHSFLPLSCAVGLLFSAPLAAQTLTSGDQNTVLVIVDGQSFTEKDVRERLGPILSRPEITLENQYPNLIEQFILEELLNNAATKAGYASDPRVLEQVKRATFSFVNQFYYEDQIAAGMNDEMLMDEYQKRTDSLDAAEEIQASHILLETEDEANALIQELNDGADFAELAKKHSTGPSGASGGDLGYFGRGQMVTDFEVAAFSLEKGQYTPQPVKTQFGYHVILLVDRRAKAKPTFLQLREELLQQKRTEATLELVEKLNSSAKVERFDLLGNPLENPAQ